ncbi:MAG: GNAT family N-acetyltransferase [Candidatus Nealsonbacteria bacterium]|nr:GNAT family N-acetyltransferase [Candidatus Nealsonbacteria bacterium]
MPHQILRLVKELKKEKPEKADAIIWLQGDRYDRAMKVFNLFKGGFAPKILISGNSKLETRRGEDHINLEAMVEWLKKKGIGPDKILFDSNSFNTKDQARNSLKLAKRLNWKKIILVGSLYYQPRAFLTFLKESKRIGWKGKLINQPAQLNLNKIASSRDKKAKELIPQEIIKVIKYGINEINGKRVYLKPLTAKQATKRYCSWINDPEVNRWLVVKSTTVEKLRKYIKEKNSDQNCLLLGIFLNENGKHIGNVKLEPIEFDKKKAMLGIMIGEKSCWGQGLGSEAVRLLSDFAFKELGLKEIYLGVDPENKRGIKFYERLGFEYVGTRTIKVPYEGKIIEVTEYGMSIFAK